MKKYVLFCIIVCTATGLFAYNPPAGGESMYALTSPSLMSGEVTVAGGPFMSSPSAALAVNPALMGGSQRIAFDVSGTYVSSFGFAQEGAGGAFHVGAVIPSRWGVFSGTVQGVFSNFDALPLGYTTTVRAGFSKDILDVLYVGAAIDGGFGTSWALNLSLGIWHNVGTLGFMKDFRWGVSITGLGKPFAGTQTGINGHTADWYPMYATPRVGAAATLVSLGNFELGLAMDVSFPGFQNLVCDTSLAFKLFKMLYISSNWTVNARELANAKYSLVPSVGISFVFGVSGKKDSFLDKQGWQKSEIVPQAAYRQLYSGINAVSAGASVSLGAKDFEAPVIKIGGTK